MYGGVQCVGGGGGGGGGSVQGERGGELGHFELTLSG